MVNSESVFTQCSKKSSNLSNFCQLVSFNLLRSLFYFVKFARGLNIFTFFDAVQQNPALIEFQPREPSVPMRVFVWLRDTSFVWWRKARRQN